MQLAVYLEEFPDLDLEDIRVFIFFYFNLISKIYFFQFNKIAISLSERNS